MSYFFFIFINLIYRSTTYSYAVDMWAIGCIMGELITGEPLFPGESEIDQLYIIQKVIGRLTSSQMELFLRNPRFAGLRFPDLMKAETIEKKFIGKITRSALSFMEGVLQMNPEDRLTSTEALNHIYFKNIRNKDLDIDNKNNMMFNNEYNSNKMMMNERNKMNKSEERKEENGYYNSNRNRNPPIYNNKNIIESKTNEFNEEKKIDPIIPPAVTTTAATTPATGFSINNPNNMYNKTKRIINKRKLSEIDNLKNEYKINEEKKINEFKPSIVNTNRSGSGISNLSFGSNIKSNKTNPIIHNRAFNINNSPYQMMINMRPIKENSKTDFYKRNAEKRELIGINPIVNSTIDNSSNMKRIYNESKISESIVGSGLPTIK